MVEKKERKKKLGTIFLTFITKTFEKLTRFSIGFRPFYHNNAKTKTFWPTFASHFSIYYLDETNISYEMEAQLRPASTRSTEHFFLHRMLPHYSAQKH